ncbi:MAG TPA: hypothetical protein VEV39_13825 [Gemmatimonadales bacterium]|nr:hypothetical protein [Gemmatimonadales bacterium]
MSRKKKPPTKIRVPNPDKPARGRLKTPAHQRHKSMKDYQRRPKHRGRLDD